MSGDSNKSLRQQLLAGFALLIGLLAGWLVFAPGIGGQFIFDDYPNLWDLRRAQNGLDGVLQFALDGIGSIGRPLSLLSFAVQSHSWPAHPGDFIRVNILIHLLNAVLLFWAVLRLQRLGAPLSGANPALLAAGAMLVWTISPLQSGAVLYVVQRMTLLAGTCMLGGLVLYLAGRSAQLAGRDLQGLVLMSGGVGLGLGVGVLAKENAALFPLLLLVAEFTLLAATPRPVAWRRWAILFLGAPLALFAGYLLMRLPGDLQAHLSLGNVSTPERVMSQPRILFMYLQKMLLPELYGIRIMYDDLAPSTSLMSPWTTLPSLAGWMILLGVGVLKRRAWPLASFAILWFLASHSLESSFIPLELAFDHRNYIAIAGIALALVAGLQALIQHSALRRARPLLVGAAGAYILFLVMATWNTSRLWAQPYQLIAYWHQAQPNSHRVTSTLADAHARYGNIGEALKLQGEIMQRSPGNTTNMISLLIKGCGVPGAPMPDLDRIRDSLQQYDAHPVATLNVLNGLIVTMESGRCYRYPPAFLLDLIETVYSTPQFRHWKNQVNYNLFKSRALYIADDMDGALDELDRALVRDPAPDIYELAAEWAIESRDWTRATAYLDAADATDSGKLFIRDSYASRFEELRHELERMQAPGAP